MAATKTAPKKTKLAIKPLNDKLIVARDDADERTDAGLYLPEKAKDKPQTGTVLAAGPGALNAKTGERFSMQVRVGDRVLFTSYAGSELKIEGEEYLVMSEDDVLAIVD